MEHATEKSPKLNDNEPVITASPKVSIITAVFNGQDYIKDAILSVKSQTYANIEHIIIDGASNDSTLEIISELSHDRLKLLSEADRGIYEALNKGLDLATGDIIGFVHSDDFLANESIIEIIVKKFDHPEVEAVAGDLDYVLRSQPQKVIRHWSNDQYRQEKLKYGWMPAHPTLYLRRQVYERVGSFDTRFRISADYDFILRYFNNQPGRVEYIPNVAYKMRTGGISNKSWRSICLKMREDYLAIKENKIGGVEVLILKNLRKIRQIFPLERLASSPE